MPEVDTLMRAMRRKASSRGGGHHPLHANHVVHGSLIGGLADHGTQAGIPCQLSLGRQTHRVASAGKVEQGSVGRGLETAGRGTRLGEAEGVIRLTSGFAA